MPTKLFHSLQGCFACSVSPLRALSAFASHWLTSLLCSCNGPWRIRINHWALKATQLLLSCGQLQGSENITKRQKVSRSLRTWSVLITMVSFFFILCCRLFDGLWPAWPGSRWRVDLSASAGRCLKRCFPSHMNLMFAVVVCRLDVFDCVKRDESTSKSVEEKLLRPVGTWRWNFGPFGSRVYLQLSFRISLRRPPASCLQYLFVSYSCWHCNIVIQVFTFIIIFQLCYAEFKIHICSLSCLSIYLSFI